MNSAALREEALLQEQIEMRFRKGFTPVCIEKQEDINVVAVELLPNSNGQYVISRAGGELELRDGSGNIQGQCTAINTCRRVRIGLIPASEGTWYLWQSISKE
jgi:hypothetical protein